MGRAWAVLALVTLLGGSDLATDQRQAADKDGQ
jgi:hypothetical protein